jgi:hypothetical protein
MNQPFNQARYGLLRVGVVALAVALTLGLLNGAALAGPPGPGQDAPLVQQFEDVPDSNPFSTFINALYVDGIISGYGCGGAGEPCNPPANLPYYRPGATVTRAQMAKFVENGRRNIDVAVGDRLVLDTAAGNALDATTSNTTGEAVEGNCLGIGACWGVEGNTGSGGTGGDFNGGLYGVRGVNSGANGYGVYGPTSSTGSYAGYFDSANYRGVYVQGNTSWYSLFVDAQGSTVGAYVDGNMQVTGTCCGPQGYIVQNVDGTALEAGDVVTIVGASAAVFGDTPVITVKKATGATGTGLAGIISGGMYVPDAATKAAYTAQEQGRQAAFDARQAAEEDADANDTKMDARDFAVPDALITDAQGTVHPNSSTRIDAGGYAQIITNGPYKAVKVDASYGAINAGDLLVASPRAGFAMKAGKDAADGTVLGKALGTLADGTGTIAVLVTLK